MAKKHTYNVLLIIAILLVTSAFASVAVADSDTPSDDRTAEISDNVSVWVGAPFGLQANSDYTVTDLDESNQETGITDGGVTLFGDPGSIKTYETGAEVTFNYEENGNFDPDGFADIEDSGQIHLVKLEEEEISGINTPGSIDDLNDLFDTDDVNNNATFTDITDKAGSGKFEFTVDDEFDEPGMYAIVVTLNESGEGVILDDDKIDEIDGEVTVMGAEGVAVEKNDASINAPDEAEPGDSLQFDVDSELRQSDDIHHAVAVYDISQVETEEPVIDTGSADPDSLSVDDLTVESNIEYVRGESNVEDEILVGDRTLVSDEFDARGQFTIQDVFDRIANQADDVESPDSVGDEEILDASMTAVVTDDPSTEITVGTNEDWAETEYRVVYLTSTNTSSDQFRTATETVTITASEDGDDSDDDDTSTGGGGGGSGSTPTDDDNDDDVDDEDTKDDSSDVEDEPPETPDVEDVRKDLDEVEPNTQTTTEIVDNAPDQPGITVNPAGTESVQEITFGDDSASGNVDVREWQDPSASVSQSVTGAVSAEAEEDTDTDVSANVVTVADISPDSDEVRESSATVQMTVDADRLDDPQNAVISHEEANSWETLETTITESEDGEVTLEAETESFSLFAIAEITETETETETQPEPEESDDGSVDDESVEDDGVGTTGLIGMLVALALVVAIVVGYRRFNDDDNNEL